MSNMSNIPQFLKDHRWTVDKTTRNNPTTELWLSDSEHDTVVLSQIVKGIGNVDLDVTHNVHGHDACNLSTVVASADQKQHAKESNAMDMGMILVSRRQRTQSGGA